MAPLVVTPSRSGSNTLPAGLFETHALRVLLEARNVIIALPPRRLACFPGLLDPARPQQQRHPMCMLFSSCTPQAFDGAGDDRNGDRSGSRAEVRARTLMGKTVLAVLRKLNLGQVSDRG